MIKKVKTFLHLWRKLVSGWGPLWNADQRLPKGPCGSGKTLLLLTWCKLFNSR